MRIDQNNPYPSLTPAYSSKVPEARMRKAACLALGAAGRAKMLVLSDCPFPGLDGQQDLIWPISAPLLEALHITAPGGDAGAYCLPDALVYGSFPKLTKASLLHCTFSWNIAGFFCNLTELRLTHRSSSQLLVPDVSKTLHALQLMPSLESLHLSLESRDGYPVESDEGSFHIPPGLAKVKLPRLAVLELGLNDLLAVVLLSHISHPRERLKVTCSLPTVERARAIVECLKQFRLFKMEDGFSMDTVYLDSPFSTWDIKVYDLSRPEELPPLWAAIKVPFDFRAQICDVIGAGLPLGDMKTVMVTSMHVYRSVQQHLSRCTTLCASQWSIAQRWDFFVHGSFIGEGGDQVLPALHTLILHELDLSALPKTSKNPERLTIPKFLKELGDICQFFEWLKLFDCRIYAQEKLDVLRGKVQHFERHWSPSFPGYRGENHASTMRKLLVDGRM